MSRDKAIEAGARALWAASLNRAVDDEVERAWAEGLAETAQRSLRAGAAAVIDAAAPHLVGEPVGFIVVSDRFGAVSRPHIFESLAAAREEAGLLEKARGGGHTVVALLPVEEP